MLLSSKGTRSDANLRSLNGIFDRCAKRLAQQGLLALQRSPDPQLVLDGGSSTSLDFFGGSN